MAKLKETILKHQCALAILGLLVMAALIVYNFFIVGKFSSYPWWHRNINDADSSYVATAIGLLNNSRYTYITHPGATLCAWLGIVYYGMAAVDPAHRMIFNPPTMPDTTAINTLLNMGVQTGRVAVLVFSLFFVVVLYLLIYRLVRKPLISFLTCFYIVISKAFLQHTYQIRDELFSLLFVLLAGIVFLKMFDKDKDRTVSLSRMIRAGVLVGCCLGFAVLSKIQIGPFIVFFIILVGTYLFFHAQDLRNKEIPGVCLCGLGVLNVLIMPWWTLWRPSFLTTEYLQQLHPLSDYKRVYGPASLHFCYPVLIFLLLFLIVNIALAVWPRLRQARLMRKAVPVFFFIQSIIAGFSLSVYLILIPLSRSWTMYIENTRHVIYATISNVVYGGFLVNKTVGFKTVQQIFFFHGQYSRLLFINIFFLILPVLVIALIHVFKSKTSRLRYVFVIGVLLLGLGMDVLGTFRWTFNLIADYYAIYSILCYGLGLALWLALSLTSDTRDKWQSFLAYFVIALLVLHVGGQHLFLFSLPPVSTESTQDPWVEYETLYAHGQPFWEIIQKK
ncbi:MAG: phospholipid carrier-dependent glycosyltransferase [Candidatus Omnitrophica bacterium]|nr:phospholipid carrier-dependent glycosyltransferase [Candidatus Omnitrophota bacterium]